MVMAQPHFLLFCDAQARKLDADMAASDGSVQGKWRFTLEQLDGPRRLEAADSEVAVNHERLALMSVVRGLEALEQPSKVTLVTTSRYVSRGMRYGLQSWRESNYTWERFGVQMPIRNADLWQRVDGALRYHGVTCRLLAADEEPSHKRQAIGNEYAPERNSAAASTAQAMSPSPAARVDECSPAVAMMDQRRQSPVADQVDRPPMRRLSWDAGRSGRDIAGAKRGRFGGAKGDGCRRWGRLAATYWKWWRGDSAWDPALYGT